MKRVQESTDITPGPTPQAAPRAELRRKPYLSWLALGCSLMLTLLAWYVAARSVSGRMRDQFLQRSEQIALAITRRMQEHEALLRGGVALFVASREVNRQEFRAYFQYQDLPGRYPGIEGVGFAKLQHQGELEATIASVRGEGFTDFDVRPPGVRALYTPIVYLEPFSNRNLRAFGFDMFSERARREAMQRAWATDSSAASAIVRLVQNSEHDPQPGFLLYLPVYRGHHATADQRRSSLIGFVFSPLRTRDLMRGILGQGPTDIDYALYDEGQSDSFFDTRGPGSEYRTSELKRRRPLELAGRSWTLRLWARPNFGNWVSRWEPLAVLATGLVINLLLLYILASQTSLQSRAQSMASQMTEELTQSHAREQAQMLVSLREKETLLKEIHHRVKNNLQVVSSLLSLQSTHTQDDRVIEPLRQSQMRVLAMAALHEFLYQSRDLSRVDTRAYLSHLVTMLRDGHPSAARVSITLELDDVPLDVDRAIPCGLITNELVSNALKYAFANDRKGQLSVTLRQREDLLVLCVEDDGPGLGAAIDMEAPTTLGLSLVQLLSQQLGGTLEISPRPSNRFTITFPLSGAGST